MCIGLLQTDLIGFAGWLRLPALKVKIKVPDIKPCQ